MAVLGIDGSKNGPHLKKRDLSLHQSDSTDSEMSGDQLGFENGIDSCHHTVSVQVLSEVSTEKKHIEFLQDLACALESTPSMFVYDDESHLFTVLSQVLADSANEARSIAIKFLYDYIPICGPALDEHMEIVFPNLIRNLLHTNASVKKSTIQTLHVYFKHSLDASLLLHYVIQYGLNSPNSALRDEILIALPALIKTCFGQDHLQDLFVSLVRVASKLSESESTSAMVSCLNHIKMLMGAGFEKFINSCPPTLYSVYKRTMKNSSLYAVLHENSNHSQHIDDNSSSSGISSGQHSADVSPKERAENTLRMETDFTINTEPPVQFGFVPQNVIDQLENINDWKSRSHGMDELLLLIEGIANPLILVPQARPFLDYLSKFVDDGNFKIVLSTLNIIYKVVLKTGGHIRPCLENIVEMLVSKLSDAKVIVRQLNLKLARALMEALSPSVVLEVVFPYLRHKNARVREEIVNIITSALLYFPSSDLALKVLPGKLVPLLLDSKRRVRHAVLESLAVLAQKLGEGRLHPLVSAVDKVEIQPGGDGALNAVQTRISRCVLPSFNSDGLVEYGLSLSPAHYTIDAAPDVAWILAASSGSAIEGSRSLCFLDGSLGVTSRPFFSAGRKKLPWQAEQEIVGNRKNAASAPVRSVEPSYATNEDAKELGLPIQGTWMSGPMSGTSERFSYLGNAITQANMSSPDDWLQHPSQYPRSESDGSYFQMYKRKMKKMKAAGLRADSSVLNYINGSGSSPVRGTHVPQLPSRKGALRPTHFVGDLSSSAGNKLSSPVGNGHVFPWSPGDDSDILSCSWSGTESELGLVRGEVSGSAPASLNSTMDSNDGIPIPTKPTLARSASKSRHKLGSLQDRMSSVDIHPTKQGSVDVQSPMASNPSSLGLEKRVVGDLESPFPFKPTIVRSPSGSTKKDLFAVSQEAKWIQTDFSKNSTNLKDMRKLSKSSPSVSAGYQKSLKLVFDDSFEKSDSVQTRGNPGLGSGASFVVPVPPGQRSGPFAFQRNDNLDNSGHFVRVSPSGRAIGQHKYGLRTIPFTHLGPANDVSLRGSPRTVGEISAVTDFTDNNNNSERHHFSNGFAEHEAGAILAQSARDKMRKLKEQHLQQLESQIVTTAVSQEVATEGSALELPSQTSMDRRDRLRGEPAAHQNGHTSKMQTGFSANARDTNRQVTNTKTFTSSLDPSGSAFIVAKSEIGKPPPKALTAAEQYKELERQYLDEQNLMRPADAPESGTQRKGGRKTSQPSPAPASHIVVEGAAVFPTSSGSGPSANAKTSKESIKQEESKLLREIEGSLNLSADDIRENSVNSYASVNKSKIRRNSFDGGKKMKSDDAVCDDFIVQGQKTVSRPCPPKASASPQIQRKNLSPSSNRFAGVTAVASATSKSHSVVVTGDEMEKPVANPQVSLSDAMKLLGSNAEDWEAKCEGLVLIRRLARHHTESLCAELHTCVAAVLMEVKNLRSQVTRMALACIADLLEALPKAMEPELDLVLKTVVARVGDTNQFIREDAMKVLDNVADFIQPSRALASLIGTGASHRNALIRKASAKTIADIAEKVESGKLPSAAKDIVIVAAKLALDPQPEARYHGRRILFVMLDEPGLDLILEKQLPQANLKPIKDVLENLRNKGLGELPSDNSSAKLRKSVRNLSSTFSPATTRKAGFDVTASVKFGSAKSDAASDVHADREDGEIAKPNRKSRKSASRDELPVTRGNQLNMDCLGRLDSSDWNERLSALEEFYDYVSLNPSVVSAHAIKVFDKFCHRLNDSNSKVSLTALQVLDRCIPILRNGMSSTTTIVVDNLKLPLASKNESIYVAAKECLISLTKYVDHTSLIQPFATCLQFGNKLTKPEMADLLAAIIIPVYSRKPGLVNRVVLPVIWNVLSSTGSGSSSSAVNRVGMSQAMSRLCNCVYQCLGDVFLQEAASQGSRVSQRLEALLR